MLGVQACFYLYEAKPFVKPLPPHLSFENQTWETYENLTENLTSEELRDLEKKLDLIRIFTAQIDEAVEAITKGNVENPIFSNHHFPLFALLALKEQRINGLEFTTSQLFFNALKGLPHENVEVIHLFEGKNINPRAKACIEQTAKLFLDLQEIKGISIQKLSLMDESQLQLFFQLTGELSDLERIFLLVPDPNPVHLHLPHDYKNTISTKILLNYFNLFGRLVDSKKFFRMIPSKGMVLSYLKATSRDHPITLKTYFKLNSFLKIKDNVSHNEWPLCLNFSFLEPIQLADGKTCDTKLNELEWHDIYHSNAFNYIPLLDRKKFCVCGDIFNGFQDSEGIGKKIAQSIYNMEHVDYQIFDFQKLPILHKDQIFWVALARCIFRKLTSKRKANYKQEDNPLVEQFIKTIMDNAEFYKKNYNLSLDYLFPFRIVEGYFTIRQVLQLSIAAKKIKNKRKIDKKQSIYF